MHKVAPVYSRAVCVCILQHHNTYITKLNDAIETFIHEEKKITNLEMETSGIYGMAKLLGHKAISMNAILANRPLGQFSQNPQETVDRLIQYTLDKLIDYIQKS